MSAAGGENLAAIFRRLIASTGPISLMHYMGEANARYYTSRDPLGSAGDFARRFMGRMETGKDTISDPAMAAGLPGWALDYARDAGLLSGPLTTKDLAAMAHPDLPEYFQNVPRAVDTQTSDKDSRYEFLIDAAAV